MGNEASPAGRASAADFDERTSGAAPRLSFRQQSGIGQQSGETTLAASSASEQQGRLKGIPNPERRLTAMNAAPIFRSTLKFYTPGILHFHAFMVFLGNHSAVAPESKTNESMN